MKEIQPTREMIAAAKTLRTGEIIVVYKDVTSIRMETEYGTHPYVWRDGGWRPMKLETL